MSEKAERVNPDPDIDRVVEIERLAGLDPINYEAVRAEAAKRLGVRAAVLDSQVAKKRRKLGLETDADDDGQGRILKIIDVMPWPEAVEGDHVLTALSAALKTYAVMSEASANTIACWVLHTWLVDHFTISPRLAITSPTKGCGKTTILRLLNHVVRRPKRAGSISPPALFRAVEKFKPTILLDETEKYVEHGSDLHGLLNEGHCKGGTILRVIGDKLELREFGVFGAVALARNGKLPDDLEQRSIVIEMQRRRPDESLVDLREDRCRSLQNIARMCARWSDDHASEIADADPDMGELINRDSDNWRPLFTITDIVGSDWPERIREAAGLLRSSGDESTGPMLLADIKSIYTEKAADRLASAELCEALVAIEGRPWAEWRASRGSSAKPMTPNQLAKLLRPFGIVTNTPIRIGERVAKGYYRTAFEEAWKRYIPVQEASERLHGYNSCGTSTSAIFQKVTKTPCNLSKNTEKPNNDGQCNRVTFRAASNSPPAHAAGLSPRLIDAMVRDVEDWIHDHYDDHPSEADIEAEIRSRLIDHGLYPEAIGIELERVLQQLYEPRLIQ
jgi:putative DNA primase/helicase